VVTESGGGVVSDHFIVEIGRNFWTRCSCGHVEEGATEEEATDRLARHMFSQERAAAEQKIRDDFGRDTARRWNERVRYTK